MKREIFDVWLIYNFSLKGVRKRSAVSSEPIRERLQRVRHQDKERERVEHDSGELKNTSNQICTSKTHTLTQTKQSVYLYSQIQTNISSSLDPEFEVRNKS